MRYTSEQIRRYRKQVIGLEKLVCVPAKSAVVGGSILSIYPVLPAIVAGHSIESILRTFTFCIPAYVIATLGLWWLLFFWKKSSESISITKILLQGLLIIDLIYLSMWLYIGVFAGTGPLESNLFWIYCLIIIRNVIYFPNIARQVVLTIVVAASYLGTYFANLARLAIRSSGGEGEFTGIDGNALGLRIIIIVLVNVSAWGVYTIYKRHQEMEDDMQEGTIRSERLNLAGVVAKETAHSLKNPLAIISNACFLLTRYGNEDKKNVKKQLGIISSEVERADKIITELMTYSTLADGRIEKADVNAAVEGCLKDLENETERRQISVVKTLGTDLPGLMIDHTQLQQVIMNIVLNAFQASKNQGEVRIGTEHGKDGVIRITISDDGKGMPNGEAEKIFKSFYTTKEGGTGLGLSIVHTIVQAYSGGITVESVLGKGTVFVVAFPTRTERMGIE